jgi:hypothetical protein
VRSKEGGSLGHRRLVPELWYGLLEAGSMSLASFWFVGLRDISSRIKEGLAQC